MASPRSIKISAEDIDALARIMHAEAGNQSDTGKLGVLFTVLNRVASPGQFRDSIRSVIEQPNQFEPMNGRKSVFDLPAAPDSTRQLAATALAQLTAGQLADPTNGATFFQNVSITNQRGTNFAATEPVAVIDDHSFYNRYKLNPVVKPTPYIVEMDDSLQSASISPPTSSSTNLQQSGGPSDGASPPSSFASLAGTDLTPHPGNPLFAYAQALGADAPLRFAAGAPDTSSGNSNPFFTALSGQSVQSQAADNASLVPATQGEYGLVPAHKGVSFDGIDGSVLDAARLAANRFGSNLSINSGYRSQARQDQIRAAGDPNRPTVAKHSHHTSGRALDIATSGMSLEDKARLIDALVGSGFTGIGHYDSHIHADFRDAVPSSFGTRPNWAGWTNMPEPLMRVLQRRGFAPGASASAIRRGFS